MTCLVDVFFSFHFVNKLINALEILFGILRLLTCKSLWTVGIWGRRRNFPFRKQAMPFFKTLRKFFNW